MSDYREIIQNNPRNHHEIAKASGISVNTIRGWLYHNKSPSVHNLKAVLNAIGYDVVIIDLEG